MAPKGNLLQRHIRRRLMLNGYSFGLVIHHRPLPPQQLTTKVVISDEEDAAAALHGLYNAAAARAREERT